MFLMQAAQPDRRRTHAGTTRRGVFFRVALPLARPAVAVGLSLALLEALNDIGASEFLGVRTLTVSIYTTWITRSDLAGRRADRPCHAAFVVGARAGRAAGRGGTAATRTTRSIRGRCCATDCEGRVRAGCPGCALPIAVGFLVPGRLPRSRNCHARPRCSGLPRRLLDGDTQYRCAVDPRDGADAGRRAAGRRRLRINRGRAGRPVRPARLARLRSARHGARHRPAPGGRRASTRRSMRLRRRRSGISTGLLILGSGAALVYAYPCASWLWPPAVSKPASAASRLRSTMPRERWASRRAACFGACTCR